MNIVIFNINYLSLNTRIPQLNSLPCSERELGIIYIQHISWVELEEPHLDDTTDSTKRAQINHLSSKTPKTSEQVQFLKSNPAVFFEFWRENRFL